MKLLYTLILISFLNIYSFGQVASPKKSKYYWSVKEFSKDIALFRAKDFVVNNVFGENPNTVQFELDPLAAASSGDLTSLVYRSEVLNMEGLILGFFGNHITDAGTPYQAYAFKNLPAAKAKELLNIIESRIKENDKYLSNDAGSNNIYFSYDDLTFIIDFDGQTNIRVFWNDFDAKWDGTAFKRTKRRLFKKLD
jgi:hypothetical protein